MISFEYKAGYHVISAFINLLFPVFLFPISFNRVCSLTRLFEKDENSLLRKTLDYITSGSFNILRNDTYCVDHPFEDDTVLYTYFMKNYMTEKDDSAVEKMQAIIGSKKTDRPLIIQDMVNIFLMTPRPPEMD